MKIAAQLFNRPDTLQDFEWDGEGCPACEAVWQLGSRPGTYYVVIGFEIWETQQLDDHGQVMLCQNVTHWSWKKLCDAAYDYVSAYPPGIAKTAQSK